jgi:hypothetical protein
MQKKFLFAILSIIIILSSCQKEISIENIPNPNPNPGVLTADSNYLSKIYYTYFDGVSLDTIDIFSYTFDNNKRVVLLTDTSDYTGPNHLYSRTQYFYNAADTLPYKSIRFEHHNTLGVEYIDTTTTFIFFNTSGQKIKDSVISQFQNLSTYVNKEIAVHQYTYSPLKIYGATKTILFYTLGGSLNDNDVTDTATLDAKGNIISNIKNRYNAASLSVEKVVSTLTYDANPSPFAHLTNFKAYMVFPSGETLLEEFVQKNNRLHTTEITSSPFSTGRFYEEDYTGQYLYRPDGYPKEIYGLDNSAPGSYARLLFIYKSL